MRGQEMSKKAKTGCLRVLTASITGVGSAIPPRANAMIPSIDRHSACASNQKILSL
jgi:hypothetical protein